MVQDCEGIVPAHVDPEIAFQKGDRDAKSILWMRCLRTFTLVLFAVGGIIAVLAHRFDEHLSDDLKTPLGLAHSLTTPLAVLAIAVGLRVLVTVLAYLLFLTFLAHLGAALVHALIFKDGVFESMTRR